MGWDKAVPQIPVCATAGGRFSTFLLAAGGGGGAAAAGGADPGALATALRAGGGGLRARRRGLGGAAGDVDVLRPRGQAAHALPVVPKLASAVETRDVGTRLLGGGGGGTLDRGDGKAEVIMRTTQNAKAHSHSPPGVGCGLARR